MGRYISALLLRVFAFFVSVWLYFRRDAFIGRMFVEGKGIGFAPLFISTWKEANLFLTTWALHIIISMVLISIIVSLLDKKMRLIPPVSWLPCLFKYIRAGLLYLSLLPADASEQKKPVSQERSDREKFNVLLRFLNVFYICIYALVGATITLFVLYAGIFSFGSWFAKTIRATKLIPTGKFDSAEIMAISLIFVYALFLEGTILYYKVRDYYSIYHTLRERRWLI